MEQDLTYERLRVREVEQDITQELRAALEGAVADNDVSLVQKILGIIQRHPWITLTIVVACTVAGIALGYLLVQYGIHVVVGQALVNFATYIASSVGSALAAAASGVQSVTAYIKAGTLTFIGVQVVMTRGQ